MACMAGNASAASSAVGCSRSGRKILYMGSLCSSIVSTLVGWIALTLIFRGARMTANSRTSCAIARFANP